MNIARDNNAGGNFEETSMSGAETFLVKKVAEFVITNSVPKVTEKGRMLWSGRKFLILGPARSGKTSFLDYLEYLTLEPEKLTATTVQVHKGKDRILRLGPEQRLVLRVRKPRDVPGQAPIHQIQYIKDYTPHCIVIVLDATRFFGVPPSESTLEWLRQFCRHLDILMRDNRKVSKRLKSMIVVMNKWDKMASGAASEAEDKDNQKACELYIRDILDETLHNKLYVKGGTTNNVEVVRCALVSETAFGESLAKQLVQSIALSLTR